ncbi:hypothetical protein RD110_02335 [Rhodoferax koreense]|uniref:Carbon monoxide dehydrogenase n=1 Tax=Rhodoferax koreensis TaxID=1842727 RepID=A0A1P8JR06_9BURK|nr:carbon monoxide dehydrogenase subunit G [Rhodoferax koreense]APW36194.1 hypothetical protein RD110_02335 [Rhodoferax koreense]
MNYEGHQLLSHPAADVWQALLDPEVLRACIAGCERFERLGESEYKSMVKISIGPVSARFASTMTLAEVVAPQSCTLQFAGQGGVAGFGKGSARVLLTAQDGGAHTRLDWSADAHIGGRLAQIGSRLIEATVRKMSEDFFERFAAQLAARPPQADVPSPVAEVPVAPAASARPPVQAWARAVAVALAAGLVYWLCFKG